MTSPSKRKGNRFEHECVSRAQEFELESQRAWGSDGRSLGMDSEVDMLIEDWTVQCKIRKALPKWIKPANQSVDIRLIREDRGDTYAIVRYGDFLDLLREVKRAS